MLFNVRVVSQADFDAHIQRLRAEGNVGTLDSNLGRSHTPPGPGAVPGANPNDVSAASGLTAVAFNGDAPNDRLKPSRNEFRNVLPNMWFSWTVTI
jgi:hypothetical protein